MNLKESFRYQNFLEDLMSEASCSLRNREHCLVTKKAHFRKKANPDAENIIETVETEDFYNNDIVVKFMQWLIEERNRLTTAIVKAKTSLDFDLDAVFETNKFRHRFTSTLRDMLRYTVPKKTIEQGRDYKFNNEGNQTPYVYDIEVVSSAAYDTDTAKKVMREAATESDRISTMIDLAMINTTVDYEPTFDVNDSWDDVMKIFSSSMTA